jgi:iron complex transport system substrate-binding protein
VRRPAALAFALALLAAPAARAGDVVSLNLCTDQMLTLLAPGRVAALSPLARDPSLSVVAEQARHLPWVRPSAEAVLALHPRLVLATRWGAQTTLAVLEAHGVQVLRVDLPQDFPAVRAETLALAATLGVPARGAALVARMDATLAALPGPLPRPIRALVLEPRGYTAGAGSLADAVLRAAGLANAEPDGRRLGIEALLRHPPDLLVVPETPRFPSLATAMLAHPALAALPRVEIPPALTICGGPFTARAAALLAAAAEQLR